MSWLVTILLGCLVAGAWVYCVLPVIAARRYRAVRPPSLRQPEPVSILKPLHGLDEGLEENLRSFFEQDYPAFELLFAAREASDPALALVERLRAACERGVQVLIVAFGTAVEELEVHARMKVLPHEGHSEMFRGPNTEMFTMTTDVSGMVIANHPAGQPSTASYARNRSIVHVVQTLLLH